MFLELRIATKFMDSFAQPPEQVPGTQPQLPKRSSVYGAIEMAATALAGDTSVQDTATHVAASARAGTNCWVPPLASLGLRSPTELRNPLSTHSGCFRNTHSYSSWTSIC